MSSKNCFAQDNTRLPHVYMLQRFVAHYRMPVFLKLQESHRFDWTFWSDEPEELGSGLPASNLARLRHCRVNNRHLGGPFIYQAGLRFGGDCQAIVMDIGLPLLSAPRYLVEARYRRIGRVGWTKAIPQNPASEKSILRRLYQRWLLSLTDTLVVYSKMSRDFVIAQGYPDTRVFIAQNSIDTRAIASQEARFVLEARALRVRLGIEPGSLVCGFLGKMAPFKRVDKIIDAFAKATTAGTVNAALVLAGKGPALDALRAHAAASVAARRIYFLSEVPAGEEGAVFQLFDLYLSFSQGGLGILEAMAHARPVLSTPERYPETELLEDGLTAFIAADSSVESFSQRMREALVDLNQLRRIGKQARLNVLSQATAEGMANAIEDAVVAAMQRATNINAKGLSH